MKTIGVMVSALLVGIVIGREYWPGESREPSQAMPDTKGLPQAADKSGREPRRYDIPASQRFPPPQACGPGGCKQNTELAGPTGWPPGYPQRQ